MLIYFKLIISTIIFTLAFQGCGENNTSASTLGDAVSITSNDATTGMAPAPQTLKSIGKALGAVLAQEINTLNQTEATAFRKQLNYCDVSGEKESQNLGTLQKITSIVQYKECKEAKSSINGKVQIQYTQVNSEGKYPKALSFSINEEYTYNGMELKKGLSLTSSITYDGQNIKSITLTVNGKVHYELGNYTLSNSTHTLTY